MSNLLQTIIASQGGAIVNQIAKNFGLSDDVAKKAVSMLMPALSRGIQQNAAQQGGIESLLGALSGNNPSQYFDNPGKLANETATNDGNGILGMIFNNNKDISRNIASHAAQETGVDASILKKMLPLLASIALGSITRQAAPQQSGGAAGMLGALAGLAGSGQQQNQGSFDLGALSTFLDADKDGSIVDDVLNMAKKFF